MGRDVLRIVVAVFAMSLVTGCSYFTLPPCGPCAVERDEVLAKGAADGVVVYGLTVRRAGASTEIEGAVDWLVETAGSKFPELVSIDFPDEMRTNQRRLVVWRGPAGTWSIRQARWEEDDRTGASPAVAGQAMASIVAAGEVTYVGDITIDADRHPVAVTVADNGAASAAALKTEFPNLAAPVVTRVLKDLRIAPRGGGPKAVGY
jgi:hypothetical protein